MPCLLYEKDPKGKWIVTDTYLEIPLGYPIPQAKEDVEVTIRDIDKTIRIINIKNAEWKMEGSKGLRGIILEMKIGYWSDENGVIQDKPKLRLVK